MRRARLTWLVVLVALLGLLYAVWAWREVAPPKPAGSAAVTAVMSGDATGFTRALGPRAFEFPADHGPHPDFRQEWWYYTGNLETIDGRRFGYQLTFFRFAVTPEAQVGASAWAVRDVYLAHFTLSDIAGQDFHAAERTSRTALGLAGAQAEPYAVWLEDWHAEGDPHSLTRLQAHAGEVAIELELRLTKPLVLQGDGGLSQKSAAAGNASYYYSMTRLDTAGVVRVGQQTFTVRGLSWMDREWSTSALDKDQVGWDWAALHLDDGSELMYYQLRGRDGGVDPQSRGVLVDGDGGVLSVSAEQVQWQVLDHWRSPRSRARYPARWRVVVEELGLELELTPALADQELNLSFRYWEGAVTVRGRRGARSLSGTGYVELVGYE